MLAHTAEPWPAPTHENDTGPGDDGFWEWWEIEGVGKINTEADARRIVACVNALRGIDMATLEELGPDTSIVRIAARLAEQRRELLDMVGTLLEAFRKQVDQSATHDGLANVELLRLASVTFEKISERHYDSIRDTPS